MDKLKAILFLWLLSAMGTSCLDFGNQPSRAPDELINSSWQLVSFDDNNMITELDPADTILLRFEESGSIEGEGRGLSCNNYSGVYSINDTTIRFENLTSTEALCPGGGMYWYYYDLLQYVNRFQVNSSRLYLYYDDEGQRLVFNKTSGK